MALITLEYASAMLAGAGLSEAQLAALPAAIEAASAAVERWCGRTIGAADAVEVVRPDWHGTAMLSRFPVQTIRRAAYGRAAALLLDHGGLGTTAYRATAAFGYPAGADPLDLGTRPSGLVLTELGLDGTTTVHEVGFDVAPTAGLLAQAVNALPAGWTARVGPEAVWGAYPSAELFGLELAREVVRDLRGLPDSPTFPVPVDGFAWALGVGQLALDRRAGLVRFEYGPGSGGYMGDLFELAAQPEAPGSPVASAELAVFYRAGYDPVPADVQSVVAEAAKAVLQGHAADSTLHEESGLNYSYKLRGAADAAVCGLSEAALRALSTYRAHRA